MSDGLLWEGLSEPVQEYPVEPAEQLVTVVSGAHVLTALLVSQQYRIEPAFPGTPTLQVNNALVSSGVSAPVQEYPIDVLVHPVTVESGEQLLFVVPVVTVQPATITTSSAPP